MKSEQQIIFDRLKSARYFEHTADESLRILTKLAELRHYGAGETILEQGQQNDRLYVIAKGEVSVKVDGQLVYGLKRKGDIFGEINVVTGNVCEATVEAKEPVEVITISLASFSEIRHDGSHELHHVFHAWLTRVLSEKLVLATEKAKRYERLHNQLLEELETAKIVQQAVCSSHLTGIPGLQLSFKSEFADVLGGDIYGIFDVSESRFSILIGDVSGHGTPAALIAMGILNSFQHFSKGERSSKRVLERVNNLAQRSMPHNRFMTAFYGIYDAVTHDLVYTNAGHHPALLLRNGRVRRLPVSEGIPVGIHQSGLAGYSEREFRMKKDDRLFLFTDGVFESLRGRSSSLVELENILEEHAHLSSQELHKAILDYRGTSSSRARKDDVTLMIFEVL